MDQSVVMTLAGGGEQWVGLIGALLGAVLGAGASGIASYLLQRREHDRVDGLRKADRRERQRSVAHRMYVKLIALQSDLERLQVHLDSEMRKVPRSHDAWPLVLALFVDKRPLAFDGEETSLLLDLDLNEQFNLIGALPEIRNQAHEVMVNYEVKREALWAMLPQEAFTDTGVEMTPGLTRQTLRIRSELEGLIRYLAQSLPGSNQEALVALKEVHAALTDKGLIKFKLDMSKSSLEGSH
ncbi:hypothetical protein ABE453_16490 [Brevundimonas diminuta]|uniref:hypothetical protein n=1 Tax=Brevundimonas diminuta TaxID=293 RepID=UPI00320ABDD8